MTYKLTAKGKELVKTERRQSQKLKILKALDAIGVASVADVLPAAKKLGFKTKGKTAPNRIVAFYLSEMKKDHLVTRAAKRAA